MKYKPNESEKLVDKLKKKKRQDLSEFTVEGLNQWMYVYEHVLTQHDKKINQTIVDERVKISLNIK